MGRKREGERSEIGGFRLGLRVTALQRPSTQSSFFDEADMEIQGAYVLLMRFLAISMSFLMAFTIVDLGPRPSVRELHHPRQVIHCSCTARARVDPGQPPTPFERSGADLSFTVSPIEGNKQVIQSNCSAGAAAGGDLQQAAETCIRL